MDQVIILYTVCSPFKLFDLVNYMKRQISIQELNWKELRNQSRRRRRSNHLLCFMHPRKQEILYMDFGLLCQNTSWLIPWCIDGVFCWWVGGKTTCCSGPSAPLPRLHSEPNVAPPAKQPPPSPHHHNLDSSACCHCALHSKQGRSFPGGHPALPHGLPPIQRAGGPSGKSSTRQLPASAEERDTCPNSSDLLGLTHLIYLQQKALSNYTTQPDDKEQDQDGDRDQDEDRDHQHHHSEDSDDDTSGDLRGSSSWRLCFPRRVWPPTSPPGSLAPPLRLPAVALPGWKQSVDTKKLCGWPERLTNRQSSAQKRRKCADLKLRNVK